MPRDANDPSDPNWPVMLRIDTPSGPLYYHIHNKRLSLFDWVPRGPNTWAGESWVERSLRIRSEVVAKVGCALILPEDTQIEEDP